MESPADRIASGLCRPGFHLPLHDFAPVWAALAAIAAQAAGLVGPFQYDDWRVIVGDPAVHSLAAWWGDQPGLRPLLKLSYALNWAVDPGPIGFHLVNLLIHAACAAIAARLAGTSRHADPAGRLALVTGLLFALHPLQTEAVTYICGRSASLSTLLLLAALLAHVRRRWGVELALFAAAVAVKETAVIYPLLLLVWDRWAAKDPPPLRRGLVAIALALLGLAGLAAIPVYGQLAAFSAEVRPLADTVRGQISGLAYLGQRVVLPIDLGIDPDLPSPRDWSIRLAAQALAIAGVAAVAWIAGRRRPWWRLALVWAMAALLPTYSVLPRIDLVAERHAYLAALGIWLALAAEVSRVRRPLPVTVLGAFVLAGLTILRCLDFRSEVALWRAASVQSPHKARVWNNLGFAYALEGRTDEAALAFRRALSIDPDFVKARNNLNALPPP